MRTTAPADAAFGVFLAFALMPLSGLGTDIYLPSLPEMSRSFGVAPARVQLSISLFLAGYGIGQFFVGSIMDSFGRYRLGLLSLLLFGLSSLAIPFSADVDTINTLRLLQGMLGAVVVVGKRAFFVDCFSGPRLKHYLSLFTVFWALGPIIGPFIGGYLQTWFGWRASFYFLAGYAWLFLALELWRGGESLAQRHRFHLGDISRRYFEMLTHRAFMQGILVISLSYGTVMLFNLAAPFIIEHTLHQTPVATGHASLLMGLAWMVGGLAARSQLHRPLLQKFGAAVAAMLALAIAMAASYAWFGDLATLLLFAFCIHAAAGVVFNIHLVECLGMFPRYAALSGGLVGGLAFNLTSALTYGTVSAFLLRDQRQLAWGYLAFALLIAVLWGVARRVKPA